MGVSHAVTGLLAGVAAAPVVGVQGLAEVAPFAVATAGGALLPDLDHPGASASRFAGPVTGGVSWLLRKASAAVYAATKGPRDERCTGTHRHLSHTVAFAAALGAAVYGGTAAGGPWAVAAVLVFVVALAASVLGDWALLAAGAGIAAPVVATGGGVAVFGELAGPVGAAVAVGCVVHCLGDALTLSGCPFLWPVPIAGETWYELRPPRVLRFRTGGGIERFVVLPVCLLATVALAWPLVGDQFGGQLAEFGAEVMSR